LPKPDYHRRQADTRLSETARNTDTAAVLLWLATEHRAKAQLMERPAQQSQQQQIQPNKLAEHVPEFATRRRCCGDLWRIVEILKQLIRTIGAGLIPRRERTRPQAAQMHHPDLTFEARRKPPRRLAPLLRFPPARTMTFEVDERSPSQTPHAFHGEIGFLAHWHTLRFRRNGTMGIQIIRVKKELRPQL
jgi:hypothetical protein